MYFINDLSLMEFVQFQGQTENTLNLFSYLRMSPLPHYQDFGIIERNITRTPVS